jgi:hypothetical protein
LKERINEFETNTNTYIRELYGDINENEKGYRPITDLVKDESCDLFADSHNI